MTNQQQYLPVRWSSRLLFWSYIDWNYWPVIGLWIPRHSRRDFGRKIWGIWKYKSEFLQFIRKRSFYYVSSRMWNEWGKWQWVACGLRTPKKMAISPFGTYPCMYPKVWGKPCQNIIYFIPTHAHFYTLWKHQLTLILETLKNTLKTCLFYMFRSTFTTIWGKFLKCFNP
jgi:hypothetical protein